jgi:toluene monooxygenase system ferredoxin subunit
MRSFEVDGHEVLIVGLEGGAVRAYQAICPHQEIPLEEGKFDGKTLTCRAHQWVFDATTGVGINPGGCRLAAYPIKIEDNGVFVDTVGVTPCFAVA